MEEIRKRLTKSLSVTTRKDEGNTGVPAAALILIAALEAGPAMGLIRRSIARDPHSGQVCFPGGKMEAGETPTRTALRETEEEIGVPRGLVEILGHMPPATTRTTGFVVWPVVGMTPEEPSIRISPAEVAEFFWVPVGFLETVRDIDPEASLPGVMFKGKRIWGLTLRIMVRLARMLDAPPPADKTHFD